MADNRFTSFAAYMAVAAIIIGCAVSDIEAANFFREGTTWRLLSSFMGIKGDDHEYFLILKNSSEQAGTEGNLLDIIYVSKDHMPEPYDYKLRAEGDRVYTRCPGQEERLLYDFSCAVGDTITVYTPGTLATGECHFDSCTMVCRAKTYPPFLGGLAQIILAGISCNGEPSNGLDTTWIEGFGGYDDPLDSDACFRLGGHTFVLGVYSDTRALELTKYHQDKGCVIDLAR